MSDLYCLVCNQLKEEGHVCVRPLWTIKPYDWELIKKMIAGGPLELETVWQDGKPIYVNLDKGDIPLTTPNISACNKCGKRYPSAPSGTIHKCGMCGGKMTPIAVPTLDDLLAVSQDDERTVNTQPMEEWKRQVSPPTITTFDGKPLTDMTREELINACESLGNELRSVYATPYGRSPVPRNPNAQRPYQVYDFYERLHGKEEQTVDISTFLNRLADIPTVSGIVSISQSGEAKYAVGKGWVTVYCILFTHRHLPIDESDLRELGRAES